MGYSLAFKGLIHNTGRQQVTALHVALLFQQVVIEMTKLRELEGDQGRDGLQISK
jgi:hypothetical protein